MIVRKGDGGFGLKMPPSVSPLDDLPHVLQSMHLCGFFRAVGSSLDCLGSMIIGVLALPTSLRRGSLPNAEKALPKNGKSKSAGGKIQSDFKSFLDDAKTSCGVNDWIEWATQYRNMYVHRGRRTSHHQISAHESPLYDAQGRYIPRATTSERLLKHPDRTDIEAFIKSKDIVLDEEVDTTLQGVTLP